MRRIFSIAMLTVRHAVRSRVVILLLGLLLLLTVILPLTVTGDGTLFGQVQIVLSYTLGASGILLGLVLVWAGCAAIATEIRDRHIELLLTKPLRAGELWLGKWLGLVALTFLMLAFSGCLTYALLRWTLRPSQLAAEDRQRLDSEILVARRVFLPRRPDIEGAAREELTRRRAAGDLPPDLSAAEALDTLRDMLRIEAGSVRPGHKRTWLFDLPRRPAEDQPLFLEYTPANSLGPGHEVAGLWLAGTEEEPGRFQQRVVSAHGGVYSLSLPREAVGESGRLVLEYANINPAPVTVLFMEEDDVMLLLHAGSFAANYLRTLLVLWIQLSFLAAIGVTAGTCLSLPVAVFTSAWLMLMLRIGGYLETLAGQRVFFEPAEDAAAAGDWANRVLQGFFRLLHAALRPLQSDNPLEHLITGRLVGWDWIATDAIIKMGLYGGLLGLVGYWVLSRREVGISG